MIGRYEKCIFTTKSKIELSQLDEFCGRLNATVPYPKTSQENQDYRDAFKSMNVSASVAIKSCHGVVELNKNGNWNPFPTKKMLNVACEQIPIALTSRSKRQATTVWSTG